MKFSLVTYNFITMDVFIGKFHW